MNNDIFNANLRELEATRAKLFNICGVYQKAKPVLKFAKTVLFFKPKWAAVIGLFITTLDEICNSE
jgi:hypothetical protein